MGSSRWAEFDLQMNVAEVPLQDTALGASQDVSERTRPLLHESQMLVLFAVQAVPTAGLPPEQVHT